MPPLSEVIFLSQVWAEAYMPRQGDAVISITDPGAPMADLNDGWLAVLRVTFDDVDPFESPEHPDDDLEELQEETAERIAAFVMDISQRMGTLIVHCKHGRSRSAGVAKAVAQAFDLQFPAEYKHANNFVYEHVLKALRRRGEA